MVREIISIQAGKCGNQIGTAFWGIISREHCINDDGTFNGEDTYQLEMIESYFKETQKIKFVPRVILVDSNNEILDSIRPTFFPSLLKKQNLIYGQSNISNNFAAGYYGYGQEIIDSVIESTRKEAESCDLLQGFHLMHSLGGGAGSGLGLLILEELQNEFPDKILSTFSVFPSNKVYNSKLDALNCVLSLSHLIETSDQVFCFDMKYFYEFALNKLRILNPTLLDLDNYIAYHMSGATCSLRFPDLLNSDLRKLSINLIPFPRFKFLKTTYVPPLSQIIGTCVRPLDVNSFIQLLFNEKDKHYFSAHVNFHGKFLHEELSERISILNSNYHYINIKSSTCHIPIELKKNSATLIENSTSIINLFEKQLSDFENIYRKKNFVHMLVNEGLYYEELNEAKFSFIDIIRKYSYEFSSVN